MKPLIFSQKSPLHLSLIMAQDLGVPGSQGHLVKEHSAVRIQMEDYQKSGLLPEILTIILAHTTLNNFWREGKLMKLYSPVKTATLNHLVSEKLRNLEHSLTTIVVSTRIEIALKSSNYTYYRPTRSVQVYVLSFISTQSVV